MSLLTIGNKDDGGWFGNNISNILGDGNEIGFWKEKWIGLSPLCTVYPTLYCKSGQQDAVVSAMGLWHNDTWMWNLLWTDELTVLETDTAAELLLLLQHIQP
ncbi:hypothetical protein L195_g027239, partial [Trifolium pratense]